MRRKPGRGEVKRLVPASPGGNASRDWPGRPDRRAAWARLACGSSGVVSRLRVVDVVEAVSPLDAQPPVVRRAVPALDVEDPLALDVVT